jgi:ring-1,2-phenylacetyl-CoA epoxidase subunit PaaC
MANSTNRPLEQFIVEWAHDEFVVGHLLGVQAYHYGPDLEENIALGSIAQDELGHTRMLLQCLNTDEKAIDRMIYEKKAEEMTVSWLVQSWKEIDWSFVVMKQWLYDLADRVRLEFFCSIPDDQIHSIQGMMKREEQIHQEHWTEWMQILSSDPEGRKRLQLSLNELYPYVAEFFATDVYRDVANQYGMPEETREELMFRCLNQVEGSLNTYQLKTPLHREEMKALVTKPGGRCGRHLEKFHSVYRDIHVVYDMNPDLVWG